MPTPIDLRSDTVTKPSEGMRRAMANAEVGDDVLDGDPTLDELQERVADLTGMESALWVPTGCMANLIALMSRVGRGDRFLAPRHAHVVSHELGTAASFAQALATELPWANGPGVPSPNDVEEQLRERGAYYDLRTPLLCLENTHNHAGGAVIPADAYRELVTLAHGFDVAVHLDGARIWHAAIAQNLTIAESVGEADTVSVCLSKGLGAPMGSVLAGPTALIANARRLRKMLGGGIRQGGVLGAAGLYALDHELPRLSEDHARARRLALGLRDAGLEVAEPQTNMVFVQVCDTQKTGASWAEAGVLASSMGTAMRLVTHRDVGDAQIDQAISRIARAVIK